MPRQRISLNRSGGPRTSDGLASCAAAPGAWPSRRTKAIKAQRRWMACTSSSGDWRRTLRHCRFQVAGFSSRRAPLRSGTRGDGSQSGLAPASRVQCASGLSLEVAMRTGCRADVPAARAIPIPPSLAVALALAALCGALACGGEAPDSAVAEDPLEAEAIASAGTAHPMPLDDGAQPAARRGGHLSYYGGRVLSRAEVVAVFWGDAVPAAVKDGAGPFYEAALS